MYRKLGLILCILFVVGCTDKSSSGGSYPIIDTTRTIEILGICEVNSVKFECRLYLLPEEANRVLQGKCPIDQQACIEYLCKLTN